MPRPLAALFALSGASWLVLTAVSFPDWLPASVDPFGLTTVFLHALALAPFMPLALALRRHDPARWSWVAVALVVGVPVGLYAALAVAALAFGAFEDWRELAANAAPLYAVFGLMLTAAYGLGLGVVRALSRRPSA